MTLVEVICAIFVLAIVFVGVLNAVAFSREMVFSNNSREKASFKGQLIADEIFSLATGCDPEEADAETKLINKIEAVVNNNSDPQNNDIDEKGKIGRALYVDNFTEPDAFVPVDDAYIQYTIEKVSAVDEPGSDETGNFTIIHEKGWNISVRVFYHQIADNSDYRCVDISLFAPLNYIQDVA